MQRCDHCGYTLPPMPGHRSPLPNKLGAGNRLQSVFSGRGAAAGQNFAACGSPASGWAARSGQTISAQLGPVERSTGPTTFQALSLALALIVARCPSHSAETLAVFRALRGVDRLTASYPTGPGSMVTALGRASVCLQTEGGASPLSPAPHPPIRVAQVRPKICQKSGQPAPAALAAPSARLPEARKVATPPMGSGVRAQRANEGLARGKARKSAAESGFGVLRLRHNSLDRGNAGQAAGGLG